MPVPPDAALKLKLYPLCKKPKAFHKKSLDHNEIKNYFAISKSQGEPNEDFHFIHYLFTSLK